MLILPKQGDELWMRENTSNENVIELERHIGRVEPYQISFVCSGYFHQSRMGSSGR